MGYRIKIDGDTADFALTKAQRRYLPVKRMADITGAAAGLVLLALPMLLIALTLKILYPHVPVLFRQERVGRDGKLFTLIKFSSMKNAHNTEKISNMKNVHNMEKISGMKNAPDMENSSGMKDVSGTESGVCAQMAADGATERGECVTKFGHFLRCTSLDELPQLFQVLSGKMSLIGPRPLILQEKKMHEMRWETGVYRLRPGLTGWAQVNGRRLLSDEKKIAFDREYMEKIGFFMDWKIFCMTVKQVIRREGVGE